MERNDPFDDEEIRLHSGSGQKLCSFCYDARCRSPANERNISIGRTFQFWCWKFFEQVFHFAETLLADFASNSRRSEHVGDKDAFFVMVICCRYVIAIFCSWKYARRNSGISEFEPFEFALLLRIPLSDHFAAVDFDVRVERFRINRFRVLGKQEVGDQHYRQLILVCQVEHVYSRCRSSLQCLWVQR